MRIRAKASNSGIYSSSSLCIAERALKISLAPTIGASTSSTRNMAHTRKLL
jgi:hypothetical protein